MPSNHKYIRQQRQGRQARPATPCPYSHLEIGKRCAWLAGHYDRHGVKAWHFSQEIEVKRKVTRVARCKDIQDRLEGKALFRVTGPCVHTGKRVNIELKATREEAEAVVLKSS